MLGGTEVGVTFEEVTTKERQASGNNKNPVAPKILKNDSIINAYRINFGILRLAAVYDVEAVGLD